MSASGLRLQDLTWIDAQAALTPDTLVVVPLGASVKEHGPRLRLDNDWTLAQYLADRVLDDADGVLAPTIGYHHALLPAATA